MNTLNDKVKELVEIYPELKIELNHFHNTVKMRSFIAARHWLDPSVERLFLDSGIMKYSPVQSRPADIRVEFTEKAAGIVYALGYDPGHRFKDYKGVEYKITK